MTWDNRIIGHGEESPDDLLAHPNNWRIHPKEQQDALGTVLDSVGLVQSVVVNQRSGFVVDGHLRIALALRSGQKSIPVTYVDLSDDEERLILASLDPIGAMAVPDKEKLSELLDSIDREDATIEALAQAIAEDYDAPMDAPAEVVEDVYTQGTNVPQYEIVGERPAVAELYDETKTDDLRTEIRAADLDDDLRVFLLSAAARHTVFDYRKVAEFYPHASPEVQHLIERSALIIIDFKDAIRDGYVRLSETLDVLREADA